MKTLLFTMVIALSFSADKQSSHKPFHCHQTESHQMSRICHPSEHNTHAMKESVRTLQCPDAVR